MNNGVLWDFDKAARKVLQEKYPTAKRPRTKTSVGVLKP